MREIFKTWWPLAMSWFLMGLELPIVSIVLARLPDPARHLAAFGGITLPICFIVEAPIIMLLSAATTLCRDRASYLKVRSFMLWSGFALTIVHVLLGFSPLYDLIVGHLIAPPPEVYEPTRHALQIMIPFTWAIGFRRFHQGLIVRFGNPRHVGIGTIVRVTGIIAACIIGFFLTSLPGSVVGALGVVSGVLVEAAYIGIVSKRVIRKIPDPIPGTPELTTKDFFKFYVPLALTSLIFLAGQPIASAALSRMPNSIESLAVWPVVLGLTFMFRSFGLALPEVVVPHLERRDTRPYVFRFCIMVMWATTLLYVLVVLTPLSYLWLSGVSGLSPELASIGQIALLIGLPLPALSSIQSWYQGTILYGRHTRAITESVLIYLLACSTILIYGVYLGSWTGMYVVSVGFLVGQLAQTLWLKWRATHPDEEEELPFPCAESITSAPEL